MGVKVIIGPGRLSYPHLLKAQDGENGPRFSTAILLPPETDVSKLNAALKAAFVEKFGPDQAKWPKGQNVRTPDKVIRKAEEVYSTKTNERTYGSEFDGWYVVNVSCNADNPPEVVDAMVEPVTNPREVYAGRWARISANAYGLNNVQLLKNAPAIAGKAPAKNDFDAVAEEMGTADESEWV
jgi:hypothetical protein